MNLRLATASDAQGLSCLHAQCFPAPWSAAQIDQLLVSPGAFALIAEKHAAEVGFILCRTSADEGEILTLAVNPFHRRKGVGRALLTAASATAGSRGARSLFLEVATDNPPALALYDAAGFIIVGERCGYYARRAAPAVDALVLRLALNR